MNIHTHSRIFILLLLFSVMLSVSIHACGCGIALESVEVFNQLKETQAYLLIDVTAPDQYAEMPYFRMISMDEPQDVTIVFPIDQIPYDVKGKTITAREFLNQYGINSAEAALKKQSLKGLVTKIGSDIKQSSGPLFMMSNGIIGSFFFLASFGTLGANAGFDSNLQRGLIARYEFEGGAMEIYDIDSMDTLESLVKSLNMTTSGEVEKLVNKYKDYYVAVLYLKVSSVLDEQSRTKLKLLCPEKFEEVKTLLQQQESLTFRDIRKASYDPTCGTELSVLMDAATNVDDKVNGTLVQMYFRDTDKFFYPTSIVNSYKYPVTDQRYFVKTPKSLHAKLESSKVSQTGTLGSDRWYKVTSTEEDLAGKIVKASFGVEIGDFFRTINQKLYGLSFIFAILLYLLITVLPFVFLKKGELWPAKEIIIAVAVAIFGGLLVSSLVLFIRKQRRFALILLTIWVCLMVLAIISSFFK